MIGVLRGVGYIEGRERVLDMEWKGKEEEKLTLPFFLVQEQDKTHFV